MPAHLDTDILSGAAPIGNAPPANTAFDTNNQQGGVPPQNPQQQSAFGGSGANAPNFVTILQSAASASSLSADGHEYVKKIREYLAAKQSGVQDTKVEIVTLTYPQEVMAFKFDTYVITLSFKEALPTLTDVPTAAWVTEIKKNLDLIMPGNILLMNIVVDPAMYRKHDAMAARILNTFWSVTNSTVMAVNLQSIEKQYMEITTNNVICTEYIERVSPHSVQARGDIKFMLSIRAPMKNNNNNMFAIQQQQDQLTAAFESTPILAVSAYTDFSTVTAGGLTKYLPAVHITDIVSQINSPNIIPLAVALAKEIFLDNGLWKAQFTTSLGRENANIGNLLPDKDGKPWRAENPGQVETFIAQNCTLPILFLDITEGRARIPGLERFAIPSEHNKVIDSYNRFIAGCTTEQFDLANSPAAYFGAENIGTLHISNRNGPQDIDSRFGDYLNTILHHVDRAQLCMGLLSRFVDPKIRIQQQKEFYPNVEPLYVNHSVILDGGVIQKLQALVRPRLKVINGTQTNGTLDISSLVALGQSYIPVAGGTYFGSGIGNNQTFGYAVNGGLF